MKAWLSTLAAFWWHDWNEAASYPMLQVNRAVGLALMLWILSNVSRLVPATTTTGDLSYLVFAAAGYAGLELMWTSLGAFTSKLRRHQVTGMLEATVMSGVPLTRLVTAMPIFDLVTTIVRGVGVVSVAVVVAGAGVGLQGAVLSAAFALGGLLLFLALGAVSAAVTLRFKGGDPVARAVHLASMVGGGVFFPRGLLPGWVSEAGAWTPVAPVIEGIRAGLAGSPPAGCADAAFRLACLLLGSSLVAVVAVRWAALKVLDEGSLSHY